MPQPTPLPELNAVLADLVSGVRDILGANMVGAYLQGSFALGGADASSDVDFLVVVHDDLDTKTVAALNALHTRIYSRPEVWAQHLEGSYAPLSVLRNAETAPREVPGEPRPPGWKDPQVSGRSATVYPFYFLNNGAHSLVRSEHDNTLVVRWVLREHGIALAGPPAATLIAPVPIDALKAEVRAAGEGYGRALLDGSVVIDALWIQGFTVLLFCRILQSLATGAIPSKAETVEWAKANLDSRWQPLIEDAWHQRSRYARGNNAGRANARLQPNPARVAETLDFVRHALTLFNVPSSRP